MKYDLFIAACLSALANSNLLAQTSRPSSQPAALDPVVESILDHMEKTIITDVETPVIYMTSRSAEDHVEKSEGSVRFKRMKPNPMFLILFDRLVNDGAISNKKVWFAFDGRWLTEARESTGTIVKREIARSGAKVDAFELGKGPFPLPFGQRKSEILRQFTVKLAPPANGDPPGTDHLVCTPRSDSEMEQRYKVVHFFVDRRLDLPVRLLTVAREDGEERRVDFPADKIRVNQDLPAEKLTMPELPYPVTTELLEGATK